jgi:hypothetical protein
MSVKLYSPTRTLYGPVAISNFKKKLNILEDFINKNNVDITSLSYSLQNIIEISMWCKEDIFEYILHQEKVGKVGKVGKARKLKQTKEHNWGCHYRNIIMKDDKKTNQWTTVVGEHFVKDILIILGHQVILKPSKKESKQPDIITDKSVYEVKSRTWGTTGTAGEKIYGVPWKYCDIPRLFGKPLYIVLVAAQEQRDGAEELLSVPTPEKKKMIEFWQSMNIHFIQLSTLLKIINL